MQPKENLIGKFLKKVYTPTKQDWKVIGNTYSFEVPPSFGIIIKKCSSYRDFIHKAFEEREKDYLKKFRNSLAELDMANREGDPVKSKKIFENGQKILRAE